MSAIESKADAWEGLAHPRPNDRCRPKADMRRFTALISLLHWKRKMQSDIEASRGDGIEPSTRGFSVDCVTDLVFESMN